MQHDSTTSAGCGGDPSPGRILIALCLMALVLCGGLIAACQYLSQLSIPLNP